MKILFLGDVVGKPGRRVVTRLLNENTHGADVVIVNVENSAHGFGVTEQNLKDLTDAGAHVFTGGNHIFDRKEIFDFIDRFPTLVRPGNYPEGTAGKGLVFYEWQGHKLAVINLMGRVFMEPLSSPFLVADSLVEQAASETKLIFVDFHAEATAEKQALATYLNGRVSAFVGTHTHVQTADERILSGGTAYITDAGCCGPVDGIIGMDWGAVQRRMIQQLPARFEVAEGTAQACGVFIELDVETGKATNITRLQYKE